MAEIALRSVSHQNNHKKLISYLIQTKQQLKVEINKRDNLKINLKVKYFTEYDVLSTKE
ncbi:hypothetical protein VHA01S_005_01530 [Vibrio halioticoli NBRC 102217]|uniref:Uncharacterized protein n=1 Tax=Vibrio halioticoli NBRC 102217 TaxID=1219072 RepID=V5F0B8_9VIBR|nr:hypothetical protein VHA01S_005_01530 [Vibrio halioticoli NBRC 102217]